MEIRDKLIECILSGSLSCDMYKRFNIIDRRHIYEYLKEGCRRDRTADTWKCRVVEKILDDGKRLGVAIAEYEVESEDDPPASRAELKRWIDGHIYHRTDSYLVLIGYGDNLFVNVDPWWRWRDAPDGEPVVRVDRIYDYIDADYEEVAIEPDGRTYRVQGDVTISGTPLERIRYNVRRGDVERVIADIISHELTRRGVENTAEPSLVHIPMSTSNPSVILALIANLFGRGDDEALNANGIRVEYKCGGTLMLLSSYNRRFRNHMLFINVIDAADIAEYVASGGRCTNNEKINALFRAVASVLSDLRRSDVKLWLGNHLVEIRNTFPLTITAAISVDFDGVERQYIITAHLADEGLQFYADEKSEVRISHNEHGETHIRFVAPGLYRLGHVLHRRDAALVNDVIIKKLVKRNPH